MAAIRIIVSTTGNAFSIILSIHVSLIPHLIHAVLQIVLIALRVDRRGIQILMPKDLRQGHKIVVGLPKK